MKIKRFVAPDMRQAMAQVREDQGADAVILSTRRVQDGIEVIAALDYDEALVRQAARQGAPLDVAPAARPLPPPLSPPLSPPPAAKPAEAKRASPPRERSAAPATAEPAPHPLIEQAAQDAARLRSELGSLRELLESQLSSLAWNDMERRHPLRARVLRDMTRLGIEPDVARRLADDLPDRLSPEQARYLPLGVLSRRLVATGRDVADAGTTVLIGPTGVGKTTTLAKLAARAVMRHGAAQVALVSTDDYRIGAAAQLEHYARLLGVRVFPAYDAASLREVLAVLRGRRTVLIDTAGVAGHDVRLQQQVALLRDAGELRTCLVLAANAQALALDEAVRAYRPLQPQSCILTKLDEAPSLGGALSALIRHELPLDYVADGQRVPEDIAAADTRALVCRAARVMKNPAAEADHELLAQRFGMAMA
ncbi:flagellar biosynthesis protein FlhF [Fulvimonas sp. R45]|uniref:flagellar biosynthesis protein FlhF n=1 Tax=Fulvimonas sp. R45 TaxID=3045937 RepID=UPI00265FFD32|nr:flagellar biosynthesis protein FlhF [Fulvimonas sp. R45]MDO1528368.1 flagellar biosynthesis protein FlhF [Fulvimonas sp. R45]